MMLRGAVDPQSLVIIWAEITDPEGIARPLRLGVCKHASVQARIRKYMRQEGFFLKFDFLPFFFFFSEVNRQHFCKVHV